MTKREIDRRTMAFINACPLRRRLHREHGLLYFEAVRWVAAENRET